MRPDDFHPSVLTLHQWCGNPLHGPSLEARISAGRRREGLLWGFLFTSSRHSPISNLFGFLGIKMSLSLEKNNSTFVKTKMDGPSLDIRRQQEQPRGNSGSRRGQANECWLLWQFRHVPLTVLHMLWGSSTALPVALLSPFLVSETQSHTRPSCHYVKSGTFHPQTTEAPQGRFSVRRQCAGNRPVSTRRLQVAGAHTSTAVRVKTVAKAPP